MTYVYVLIGMSGCTCINIYVCIYISQKNYISFSRRSHDIRVCVHRMSACTCINIYVCTYISQKNYISFFLRRLFVQDIGHPSLSSNEFG
jgi:hypothetical protein